MDLEKLINDIRTACSAEHPEVAATLLEMYTKPIALYALAEAIHREVTERYNDGIWATGAEKLIALLKDRANAN